MAVEDVTVRPFAWQDWPAIWQIRFAQLAEHDIHLDPSEIPASPQNCPRGSYEWNLDPVEQIYFSGAGGFWLAWQGEIPLGMVGGQDVDKVNMEAWKT